MGPGPAVDIRGGCPPASPAVTHPFFPQLTGFGTVFVIVWPEILKETL